MIGPPPRQSPTATLPLLILLNLVFILALTSSARASTENLGTTGASFLGIEVGARAAGMGGAYAAVPGGAEQMAWNPATIGGGGELAASHARLYGLLSYNWIGYVARPGPARARYGLSLGALSVGAMEGRDLNGDPTGEVSSSAAVLGFTWIQPVGASAALGATLKGVREVVGDGSGFGLAADVGARLGTGPLRIAAAAQNLGPSFALDGTGSPLPRNVKLGVAYAIGDNRWLVAAEANFPYDSATDVRAGMEVQVHSALAVRTGYRVELADGGAEGAPSFGAGTAVAGLAVDYAYTSHSALDPSHRFSLTYRFGTGSTENPAGAAGAAGAALPPGPSPDTQ